MPYVAKMGCPCETLPALTSTSENSTQSDHSRRLKVNSIHSILVKAVFNFLFSIATICLFNVYPRYQLIGNELLHNPTMESGVEGWSNSPTKTGRTIALDGGVRLVATVPGWLEIKQSVERPFSNTFLLRLACDVKTIDVVGGGQPWETARIVLLSYDQNGRPLYERPHNLVARKGSSEWKPVSRTFPIGDDVASLEVAAQLIQSTGELWLRSCSLRRVLLKDAFANYRMFFLCGWLAVGAWVGLPFVFASLQTRERGLVLLLVIGIFIGVLAPESLKETAGGVLTGQQCCTVKNEIDGLKMFDLTLTLPNKDIYKTGHFVMFGLLALALIRGRAYSLSTCEVISYLLLLALVTEVLQLFIPGRGPQLGDILVDGSGVLAGLSLGYMGSALSSHRSKSQSQSQ